MTSSSRTRVARRSPRRLARVSAVHPWRVLTAWGLILAASIVAIGTLLGSAFTSDGSITTNPDSTRAQQVIADNFSQADRIDDAVIIYSADLTSDDPQFKAFVTDVRSSIEATGATETVRDPYADRPVRDLGRRPRRRRDAGARARPRDRDRRGDRRGRRRGLRAPTSRSTSPG